MNNLMVKTVFGFLFLVLALALFLSAGSLRFWQAWVYLAVFSICIMLFLPVNMFKSKKTPGKGVFRYL